MLKRIACNVDFQSKVKPAKSGAYGPENPVSDDRAQKLFDSTVREAKHEATVRGFILAASAGVKNEAETPLVCLQSNAGQITIVNGHKLLFIQSVTGANRIKVYNESGWGRAVMYKDSDPVAVLMAFNDRAAEDLFSRMLASEHTRAQIARIMSVADRRKAV